MLVEIKESYGTLLKWFRWTNTSLNVWFSFYDLMSGITDHISDSEHIINYTVYLGIMCTDFVSNSKCPWGKMLLKRRPLCPGHPVVC